MSFQISKALHFDESRGQRTRSIDKLESIPDYLILGLSTYRTDVLQIHYYELRSSELHCKGIANFTIRKIQKTWLAMFKFLSKCLIKYFTIPLLLVL